MNDFMKIPEMREPLVPLSHLELDLPAPAVGWATELAARGIEVLVDDVGRASISRVDVRQLLTEQREQRETSDRKRAEAERQAVQADQRFRATLWAGLPADHLPVDVAPAAAMFQASRDAQPKRLTPLQEALAGDSLTYHPLPSSQGEES
jgi:hypothetical protein